MRREIHESFHDGNSNFAEGTPARDVRAANLKPFEMPAAELWVKVAGAVLDWYGAMFRLALGLARTNGDGKAQSVIVSPAPAPPASVIASPAPAPPERAESSPSAALHSLPGAPVKLRPKRKKRQKSSSRAKNGTRSPSVSRIRRSRRAA